MENLAHSLTGLALAKAGLERRVPFGTAFLVAAANAPDFDVAVAPWGTLYYLHYHRGITHSLLGTVALGLLLGLAAFLLRRWSRVPAARLRDCLLIVAAAALTHPLLDWTNSYGIRLLQPFSELRSFGDLVFIVDPYLWILLGWGTFLSSPWGRWGKVLWGIGVIAVSAVGLLFVAAVPALVWYLVLLVPALLSALWIRSRRGPLGTGAAAGSLAAMVVYWGFLGISHSFAYRHAAEVVETEHPHASRASLAVIPRPADPIRWDALFEDPQHVFAGMVSALTPGLLEQWSHPRNQRLPEVQAALQTCPGQVLAHFGRFTFWEVEKRDGGSVVVFRDARFSRRGGSGFGTYRLELAPGLDRVVDGEPCPDPE